MQLGSSNDAPREASRLAARRNGQAIGAILVSSVLYMLSDAAMKLVSEMSAGERVFLRSIGVVLALLLVVRLLGLITDVRRSVTPLMVPRALGDAGNSLTFQPALSRMPFADAMGILQLTPLALTAAAALFLGSNVGWRRWTAVAVGFAGALMVLKPGTTSFNPWGLLVIAAVLAGVWRDLATRRFDPQISPLAILLVSQLGVAVISLVSAAFEAWTWPTSTALCFIAAAAVTFAGGHLAAIYAVRDSDWSVVAPFRYAGIVWAILIGVLIWGEKPDALSLLGIGLLVAAGLYTLARERRSRSPG